MKKMCLFGFAPYLYLYPHNAVQMLLSDIMSVLVASVPVCVIIASG